MDPGMAAAAPQMPTDPLGARAYMRSALEEACGRMLRRLVEDEPPREEDGVKESVAEVRGFLRGGGPPPDLQALTAKLSEVCSCDLLPPRVLEALMQRLSDPLQRARFGNRWSKHFQRGMRALKSAVLCQEKVDAFFAEERGLAYSLYRELRAVLGQRHWGRLRLGVDYGAQLGAAEADPEVQLSAGADPEVLLSIGYERRTDPEVKLSAGAEGSSDLEVELYVGSEGSTDPEDQLSAGGECDTDMEVQLSAGSKRSADPEVHSSADSERRPGPERQPCAGAKRSADPEVLLSPDAKRRTGPEVQPYAAGGNYARPEVKTRAADAAPQVEQVDLAIGDKKAGVGYYIELMKNPKHEQILVQGKKTLRAILGAGNASAPGNISTREENRVCYQIIFYSSEKLAVVSERPEHMERLLSKHSNWRKTIDCNDAVWQLPKREISVCIIEVKPDY